MALNESNSHHAYSRTQQPVSFALKLGHNEAIATHTLLVVTSINSKSGAHLKECFQNAYHTDVPVDVSHILKQNTSKMFAKLPQHKIKMNIDLMNALS